MPFNRYFRTARFTRNPQQTALNRFKSCSNPSNRPGVPWPCSVWTDKDERPADANSDDLVRQSPEVSSSPICLDEFGCELAEFLQRSHWLLLAGLRCLQRCLQRCSSHSALAAPQRCILAKCQMLSLSELSCVVFLKIRTVYVVCLHSNELTALPLESCWLPKWL